MIARSVFALGVLIGSSPAVANWQFTRWGMAPQQVVAASKGSVHIGQGRPGDTFENSLSVEAEGTHQSGDYRFRTVFYFKNGKLAQVTAKLLDPPNRCGYLFSDLSSRYGKPFKEVAALVRLTEWRDTAKNNLVGFIQIGDDCEVDYSPLKDANNSAL